MDTSPSPDVARRAWTSQALLLGLLVWAGGTQAAGAPASASLQAHHASVDSSRYPWSSLVKIFNSVGGACTGVVVARDKVLTAGHCVYAFRTRRFLPADALHVLQGYERGGYRTHVRAMRYRVGPGYDPAQERGTAASDWAILDLAAPLPADVRPLPIAAPSPRDGKITLAGFAQDRAFVMTADHDCRLTGLVEAGRLISHDCKIQPGDSGAPLLRTTEPGGETVSIVGVAIGIWHIGGRDVGVAAPLPPDLLGRPPR